MPSIEKINPNYQKPFFNTTNTGYAALSAISVTAVSSIIKPAKKYHLFFGIISIAASFLHLATILNYKRQYKNNKEFVA